MAGPFVSREVTLPPSLGVTGFGFGQPGVHVLVLQTANDESSPFAGNVAYAI